MTPQRVEEIRKLGREPVSLQSPVGDEGDAELGELIPDEDAVSPLDVVADRMRREQIEHVLASLDGREQRVLRLRFGLDDGHARTLEEVGKRVRPHPRADPPDRGPGAAQAPPPAPQPQAPGVRRLATARGTEPGPAQHELQPGRVVRRRDRFVVSAGGRVARAVAGLTVGRGVGPATSEPASRCVPSLAGLSHEGRRSP